MKGILHVSWFWHDHRGISIMKSIQLRLNFLKKYKYQIDGFVKKCSMKTTLGILEEINNSLHKINGKRSYHLTPQNMLSRLPKCRL